MDKAYKIISATDKALIGTEVDMAFIKARRASGWRYVYIKDRDVHLLASVSEGSTSYIEVSEHTLDETFNMLLAGN